MSQSANKLFSTRGCDDARATSAVEHHRATSKAKIAVIGVVLTVTKSVADETALLEVGDVDGDFIVVIEAA